jgi:signal transduction histidine kinase
MSDVRFAELISKIAHELRSPLTSVQGFSGTLVKRWDRLRDEQRLELVGTIHADAVRMGRIISDVLDLARLETGRLHLDVANVNVAAIAEKATGNVARWPGAERVTTSIPPELNVRADAARLEHIVTALVENAIKFSDSGPVEVRAEPHESTVVISVTDRGVGIEPVRIDEIFAGPAPAGQSATPTGSGLGLYLTKRLVEAHGGTIRVQSSPGRGSSFAVALPSADGAA